MKTGNRYGAYNFTFTPTANNVVVYRIATYNYHYASVMYTVYIVSTFIIDYLPQVYVKLLT